MATNQIKEVIVGMGMRELVPNDQVLKQLGVKRNSWTKWVDKTTDPEFHQVPVIAKFLGCRIEDLFPPAEEEGNEDAVRKHKFL